MGHTEDGLLIVIVTGNDRKYRNETTVISMIFTAGIGALIEYYLLIEVLYGFCSGTSN